MILRSNYFSSLLSCQDHLERAWGWKRLLANLHGTLVWHEYKRYVEEYFQFNAAKVAAGKDALPAAAKRVNSSCLLLLLQDQNNFGVSRLFYRSSFWLNFSCTEPILSSVSSFRKGLSGAAVYFSVLRASPWAPRSRNVQISSNLTMNTLLQLWPCWYACYKL